MSGRVEISRAYDVDLDTLEFEDARDGWSADWARARQCIGLRSPYASVDIDCRRLAQLCLLARGERDPLTLPLSRGKPRTRR